MNYPQLGNSGGPPMANITANTSSLGGSSNPYTIGGSLNFAGNAAGGNMFSGGLAGLAASYAGAYQNALSANQQNYNNILGGYQQTMANQTNAEQAIQGGYSQLYNNVMAGIANIGQSQSQAIQDQYAAQSGASQQALINSGLGNSTVLAGVNRGLSLDQAKANVALANQLAQTQAGYQSNLGLAGLNYQNQAVQQNTALANQQLGWMNSVQIPYPDAGQYANLAQQYGAMNQANADRALQQQALQGLQAGGQRYGSSPVQGLGYTPSMNAAATTAGAGGGYAGSGSPGGGYYQTNYGNPAWVTGAGGSGMTGGNGLGAVIGGLGLGGIAATNASSAADVMQSPAAQALLGFGVAGYTGNGGSVVPTGSYAGQNYWGDFTGMGTGS